MPDGVGFRLDPEDQQALKRVADNAFSVPLWSLPVFYVATKDLNFSAYPDEMVRFWEMTWK